MHFYWPSIWLIVTNDKVISFWVPSGMEIIIYIHQVNLKKKLGLQVYDVAKLLKPQSSESHSDTTMKKQTLFVLKTCIWYAYSFFVWVGSGIFAFHTMFDVVPMRPQTKIKKKSTVIKNMWNETIPFCLRSLRTEIENINGLLLTIPHVKNVLPLWSVGLNLNKIFSFFV